MPSLKLARKQEIDLQEVLYLESDVNYTRIYTLTTTLTASSTLGIIEQQLDHNFFWRVNRSHVINLHFLSSYRKVGSYLLVQLQSGHEFVFSRRRTRQLQEKLKEKLWITTQTR